MITAALLPASDSVSIVKKEALIRHDPAEMAVIYVFYLEQLRDLYDRGNFGLVLIGQPRLEKRLARYPQLYSRAGFVHQFHVLSQDETRWLLKQRWNLLGMHIRVDDFTDQEDLAAIVRIRSGNFRVIHRLLMQVERILEINDLRTVTKNVVEAALENLALGQAQKVLGGVSKPLVFRA